MSCICQASPVRSLVNSAPSSWPDPVLCIQVLLPVRNPLSPPSKLLWHCPSKQRRGRGSTAGVPASRRCGGRLGDRRPVNNSSPGAREQARGWNRAHAAHASGRRGQTRWAQAGGTQQDQESGCTLAMPGLARQPAGPGARWNWKIRIPTLTAAH